MAFTLTEMLIVIGIIVLVAIFAVPSFRAITGGRSVEAAQNQISAVLGRARTEAIGLQETRGVFFYRDRDTQRIGLTLVYATNPGDPVANLDLIPERDTLLLPVGIGLQMIDDGITGTDDRYIGFNKYAVPTPTTVAYGGVILFDGQGNLLSNSYLVTAFNDPDGPAPAGPLPPTATTIGGFLFPGVTPSAALSLPVQVSKIGFVVFEEEPFHNLHGEGRAPATTEDTDTQIDLAGNGAMAAGETAEEAWLNDNSTPFLVNRYNGTLLRGE